jgi:hypothetical protein
VSPASVSTARVGNAATDPTGVAYHGNRLAWLEVNELLPVELRRRLA